MTECTVCDAPLHGYEWNDHVSACLSIDASDGLDAPEEVAAETRLKSQPSATVG